MASKLTSREDDYSKWYNELVVQADLAQHSDVKDAWSSSRTDLRFGNE